MTTPTNPDLEQTLIYHGVPEVNAHAAVEIASQPVDYSTPQRIATCIASEYLQHAVRRAYDAYGRDGSQSFTTLLTEELRTTSRCR